MLSLLKFCFNLKQRAALLLLSATTTQQVVLVRPCMCGCTIIARLWSAKYKYWTKLSSEEEEGSPKLVLLPCLRPVWVFECFPIPSTQSFISVMFHRRQFLALVFTLQMCQTLTVTYCYILNHWDNCGRDFCFDRELVPKHAHDQTLKTTKEIIWKDKMSENESCFSRILFYILLHRYLYFKFIQRPTKLRVHVSTPSTKGVKGLFQIKLQELVRLPLVRVMITQKLSKY